MNCYHCNAYNSRNAKFCSFCGNPLTAAPVQAFPQQSSPAPAGSFVQQQQLPMNLKPMPGAYVPQYPSSPMPMRQVSVKKRGILLLLWLFLGLAGGHWFYVGKLGRGVLYLLTLGLFGFGWFIDFFSIVFGKPLDSHGLPIDW